MNTALMLLLVICLIPGIITSRPAQVVAATTIQVTTYSDELTNNGNCSLREAVRAANTDLAVDACPAGSGMDTINLPAGTYTLLLAGKNENLALTGDLDLTASAVIKGTGQAATTINANAVDRAFQVFAPANIEIAELTIQGGNTGAGMGPDYSGGGLSLISGSTLILTHVSLHSNTAGSSGGGIYNNGGVLTINSSTISANFAYDGGGVRNLGEMTAVDTTFHANQTTGAGGGLFNTGALTLERAAISANISGSNGGGLYLHSTSGIVVVKLNNSTVSGNQAKGPYGGGLWVYYQTELSATNTTIAANIAGTGGGLYQYHQQGIASLSMGTRTGSSPLAVGNIHFKNVIVANNDLSNCARNAQTLQIESLGHNIDSANTCEFVHPTDLINIDPLLGPLQNNGGPTSTHALKPGSLAIDGGDNTGCPATDQRGVYRPQGVACDIGAYELLTGEEANLSLTKLDAVDPVIVGDNIQYTLTVNNSGPSSATSTTLTDTLPPGVTFISAIPSQGSCSHTTGVVTCTLASIANPGSANVTIIVTAAAKGTMVNTASVSSAVADPDTANNSANASTTVNLANYLPLIRK